jgi:hypothetical protein
MGTQQQQQQDTHYVLHVHLSAIVSIWQKADLGHHKSETIE